MLWADEHGSVGAGGEYNSKQSGKLQVLLLSQSVGSICNISIKKVMHFFNDLRFQLKKIFKS
jgi:hypothetical protein